MSEIILYTRDNGLTKPDLRLEDGKIWLTQLKIADLFKTSKQNISKHIKSIFDDHPIREIHSSEKVIYHQVLDFEQHSVRNVTHGKTNNITICLHSVRNAA